MHGGAFEDVGLDARRGVSARGAVDRHADRDLAEPACESFGLSELIDPAHDVKENLLRELERLAGVAEAPQANGMDGALKLLDQCAEGVAVTALGAFDQGCELGIRIGIGRNRRKSRKHGIRPPTLSGVEPDLAPKC